MSNPNANILVPIAFLAWTPVVFAMYKKLDARIVPLAAYVAGWMFLPCADYDIFLLRNTKTTVTGLGILAGAFVHDRERLQSFRFSPADLPMALWCTAPLLSSIANGLGLYDGLSQTLYQTLRWGLPYYIGRVYFIDTDNLKTVALTIFIGGIIYIPFCWAELVMSPQLHRLTYGFHQHDFIQTMRDNGGFRPMVYMTHGLMTSMWMMLASFLGAWLHYCRQLPDRIIGIPSSHLLVALVVTTLMMQSVAALSYLALGLAVLSLSSIVKTRTFALIVLLCPYLYICARIGGSWDGRNFTDYVFEHFSPARAESMQFRFDNETLLMERAQEGSFFGWGGYGRSRVFDDSGKDLTVTDGLWIIAYGTNGPYGLAILLATVQLPAILFLLRIQPSQWTGKRFAAPAAMSIFLAFTMIDNLLNAMLNPIYVLFSGGLLGLLVKPDLTVEASETETSGAAEPAAGRFIANPEPACSRFI